MEKFLEIEKTYPALKCKACGKENIAKINTPQGVIFVCLDCLAAERVPSAPAGGAEPSKRP